ncbi:methyl-accepting chemotaxis protein [Fusibacter ferrireducens]|uniref:Methyl-accepting transducer domain-containing protein n=1 Tax=Fusibacter ferrireducens TaxID=2785058 RepID=A0ABR9ZRX7_9FIRM|nr:methyl-accepting chemotaxis protein [Fusibacter ferrireducens]MBF4692670.1 hypothetical protein [Fusibacter ferrireducens]
MSQILEHLIHSAPYLSQLSLKEIAIAVTDRHKYLKYVPGKQLDHKVSKGDLIKHGSLVDLAMKKREKQYALVDELLFGIPYVGVAIPIVDDETNEVIGSLFLGESTEKQEMLKSMAKELSDNIFEVNAFTHEIHLKSNRFSGLSEQLLKIVDLFNIKISEINKITQVIHNISKQSNMLGINAAIESARFGEKGKGFAVVAEEISNLSKRSYESIAGINEITQDIKRDSEIIHAEANTVNEIAHDISKILNELSSAVEGIYGMVEELTSLSEQL